LLDHNATRLNLDHHWRRRILAVLLAKLPLAREKPRRVGDAGRQPLAPEIHPLNAEEAKRFLTAARGNRYLALYVLGLTTDARTRELAAGSLPEQPKAPEYGSGNVT
jgi:hypothetical protein